MINTQVICRLALAHVNFVDICHTYFRDMAYFFKIIKGIWDTGTLPSRASPL